MTGKMWASTSDRVSQPQLRTEIKTVFSKYIHAEESPKKIDLKSQLQGLCIELLSVEPHLRKFSLSETATILTRSVLSCGNAPEVSRAFLALARYASNLIAHPWRPEYQTVKLFGGFYQHDVASVLVEPTYFLSQLGYYTNSEIPSDVWMMAKQNRNNNQHHLVALDCLLAATECQMMSEILVATMSRESGIVLAQVVQFREQHVGTIDSSVRGLLYQARAQNYALAQNSQPVLLSGYNTYPYPLNPNFMYPHIPVTQYPMYSTYGYPGKNYPSDIMGYPTNVQPYARNCIYKDPSTTQQTALCQPISNYNVHSGYYHDPTTLMSTPYEVSPYSDQPNAQGYPRYYHSGRTLEDSTPFLDNRNTRPHPVEGALPFPQSSAENAFLESSSHSQIPRDENIESESPNIQIGRVPYIEKVEHQARAKNQSLSNLHMEDQSEFGHNFNPSQYLKERDSSSKKPPTEDRAGNNSQVTRHAIKATQNQETYMRSHEDFPLVDLSSPKYSDEFSEELWQKKEKKGEEHAQNRSLKSSGAEEGLVASLRKTKLNDQEKKHATLKAKITESSRNKGDEALSPSPPMEGDEHSWEYVFQNLEKKGYTKDLGERGDLLAKRGYRLNYEELERREPKFIIPESRKPASTFRIGYFGDQKESTHPLFPHTHVIFATPHPGLASLEKGMKPKSDETKSSKSGHDKSQGQGKTHKTVKDQDASSVSSKPPKKPIRVNPWFGAEVNADPLSADEWACKSCTFINDTAQNICCMCGKSRDIMEDETCTSNPGRQCSECTLLNAEGKDYCEACGFCLQPAYA